MLEKDAPMAETRVFWCGREKDWAGSSVPLGLVPDLCQPAWIRVMEELMWGVASEPPGCRVGETERGGPVSVVEGWGCV